MATVDVLLHFTEMVHKNLRHQGGVQLQGRQAAILPLSIDQHQRLLLRCRRVIGRRIDTQRDVAPLLLPRIIEAGNHIGTRIQWVT